MPDTEQARMKAWPLPGMFNIPEPVVRANEARRDWERWYQAETFMALGVSFCTGVFLGWLVKRR